MLYFLLLLSNSVAATFLTITPGARQVAMASAFTGIADDFTAVYYNPAGLAFCKNPADISLGVMNPGGKPGWLTGLWPDMENTYIGAVTPLPFKIGAFGFGYEYLSTGNTIGTDEMGHIIGEWETYDFAVAFSYGKEVIKNLGIGASIKYIYSFLVPEEVIRQLYGMDVHGGDARTYAFDGGILYKTPIRGLSAGMAFQNIGRGMCYIEGGDTNSLPALVRTGIGYDAKSLLKNNYVSAFNFSLDLVEDLVRDDGWWSLGTELTLIKIFTFRGGMFNDSKGNRSGMTYGYGVNIFCLQIDVASDAMLYSFPTSNWRLQVTVNPLLLKKKS